MRVQRLGGGPQADARAFPQHAEADREDAVFHGGAGPGSHAHTFSVEPRGGALHTLSLAKYAFCVESAYMSEIVS
ncbi:hypothetical protein GA0115255_109701, partial [Streptomyces sp. Ncost-T6T-2b]